MPNLTSFALSLYYYHTPEEVYLNIADQGDIFWVPLSLYEVVKDPMISKFEFSDF